MSIHQCSWQGLARREEIEIVDLIRYFNRFKFIVTFKAVKAIALKASVSEELFKRLEYSGKDELVGSDYTFDSPQDLEWFTISYFMGFLSY